MTILDYIAFICIGLYCFFKAGQITQDIHDEAYLNANFNTAKLVFCAWAGFSRYIIQAGGLWILPVNEGFQVAFVSDWVFWPVLGYLAFSYLLGYAPGFVRNPMLFKLSHLALGLFVGRQVVTKLDVVLYQGVELLPRGELLLEFLVSDEVYVILSMGLTVTYIAYWLIVYMETYVTAITARR